MSDLQHFSIVSELLGITLISVVKGWQGAHPGAQGRQGATKMASEALRQGTFSEVVTFLVSFPCPGIWATSRRIRPRQKEKKKVIIILSGTHMQPHPDHTPCPNVFDMGAATKMPHLCFLD